MSDKHLAELPWKQLSTREKIKDNGLGKALASYGGCAEKDVEGKLKALETIEKLATALKKEHAAAKEVASYLSDVLAEAVKVKKVAELQSKESGDGGDEEKAADSATIAKKLKSFLATVKGSEGTESPLGFMAYLCPGGTRVLLAKKVGSSQKKVLQALLPDASGGKYLSGICIWEMMAHTFVMDAVPSGLAKKLRAALLEETGQKYKVRVRAHDGSGAEEDGEEGEAGEQEGQEVPTTPTDLKAEFSARLRELKPKLDAAIAAAGGNVAELKRLTAAMAVAAKEQSFAQALATLQQIAALLMGGTTEKPPEPPPQPPESPAAAYAREKSALAEGLKRCLKEQLGDIGKMRAVYAFAEEKATGGDFAAGLKGLEALKKLIAGAAPQSNGTGGKVAFEKLHLDWDSGKKQIAVALGTLRGVIAKEFGEEDLASAAARLEEVVGDFNEGLGDRLDALRNAATAEAQAPLAREAIAIADRYLAYLSGDAVVQLVEQNPFEISVPVQATLVPPLTAIKARLTALPS